MESVKNSPRKILVMRLLAGTLNYRVTRLLAGALDKGWYRGEQSAVCKDRSAHASQLLRGNLNTVREENCRQCQREPWWSVQKKKQRILT